MQRMRIPMNLNLFESSPTASIMTLILRVTIFLLNKDVEKNTGRSFITFMFVLKGLAYTIVMQ